MFGLNLKELSRCYDSDGFPLNYKNMYYAYVATAGELTFSGNLLLR